MECNDRCRNPRLEINASGRETFNSLVVWADEALQIKPFGMLLMALKEILPTVRDARSTEITSSYCNSI